MGKSLLPKKFHSALSGAPFNDQCVRDCPQLRISPLLKIFSQTPTHTLKHKMIRQSLNYAGAFFWRK